MHFFKTSFGWMRPDQAGRIGMLELAAPHILKDRDQKSAHVAAMGFVDVAGLIGIAACNRLDKRAVFAVGCLWPWPQA